MRVMIAAVGYSYMRDLSAGPVLVPRLQALDWPTGVEVEVDDWSFGPFAVVQRLELMPNPFDRIVLVASVERGRKPGSVHLYRWDGVLPNATEIQQRVGKVLMGVIALDNLLVVERHFRAFPDDIVVDVEPVTTGWGDEISPRIEAVLNEVIERTRHAALVDCGAL